MNSKIQFYILLIIMVAGFSGVLAYMHAQKPRMAYVDLKKVFDEFEMTKELNVKLTSSTDRRNKIIDSLKMDLELLARKLQNGAVSKEAKNEFMLKREQYLQKDKVFTEQTQNETITYNEQITRQMKEYIEIYRNQQQYDLLFGDDGSGNVLGGEKVYDVTEEVIAFINNKYQANS